LPKVKQHKHKKLFKKKAEPSVRFRCASCNSEEMIPKEVVDFFDIMDGGDPSVPPRFDCKFCFNGKIEPIHYIGHDGIVYES